MLMMRKVTLFHVLVHATLILVSSALRAAQVSEPSILIYNGTHVAALAENRRTLIMAFVYVDNQTQRVELPQETLKIHRIPQGQYIELELPTKSSALKRVLAVADDMDSLVNDIGIAQQKSIYKIHDRAVVFIPLEHVSEATRHVYVGWLHGSLRRFDAPEILAMASGFKSAVTFAKHQAHGTSLHVDAPEAQDVGGQKQAPALPAAKKERARVMTELEAYRIMGVRPGTNFDELERAYRDLSDRYYPQRHNNSVTERLWRDIEDAYRFVQLALVRQPSPSAQSVASSDEESAHQSAPSMQKEENIAAEIDEAVN
jgi:hypothetical protein